MSVLSGTRLAVLHAIRDSVETHGYPPTVRELATAVGLASTDSVTFHLAHLERDGWIRRIPGSPRAISILKEHP